MTAAAGTPGSDVILDRLLTLHPKIIDLSLDRLMRLLNHLGNPERALPPVIHMAGTNGKGSTCAMIRTGLEADGARAHVYTSPHLARFHERIRLAGALISEPALAALLEECEAANGNAPITFFEITTAAALLAFSRAPAEYCLLEVGLGGRLDATNVVDRPALTVITPISIDHQQYLGDTLPQIAAEKAGILKRGVPCVVGPQSPAALEVIERIAARLDTPLFIHGRDWLAREEDGRLVYQDARGLLDIDPPRLPGRHQYDNAGAAIAALRALGADDAACAAAPRAKWPARMQRLRSGPLFDTAPEGAELWLDGGHNPAAGEAIATHFGDLEERAPVPLYLVCGMLDTKDSDGFLRPFKGLVRRLYAISIPGEPNSLPGEAVAAAAVRVGLDADVAPNLSSAMLGIAVEAEPGCRILICGSLYLAGRVLRENA